MPKAIDVLLLHLKKKNKEKRKKILFCQWDINANNKNVNNQVNKMTKMLFTKENEKIKKTEKEASYWNVKSLTKLR